MSRLVYPVILCGGSGTRLWPLSRKSYPKQFVQLVGEQSLFQSTVLRLSGEGHAPPVVVTSNDLRFIVVEQLDQIGIQNATVLIEPNGRNTAPAILAAAYWLQQHDPSALMLVSPSDHVVPDSDAFKESVKLGCDAALDGQLITFGIKPDRAETGYGWLELESGELSGVVSLSKFVEKPDKARAEEMLASGRHFWNAGIFLFSIESIMQAFNEHAPVMMEPVSDAVKLSKPDLGFIRLDTDSWSNINGESIDYAVMEKATNISVVPFSGSWSDLGGWDAVWRETTQDDKGVATTGNVMSMDCENTLLRSEDSSLQPVGLGLKNTVVVAMPDAVLVADADRVQEVKHVVSALSEKNVKQSVVFPRDHRPWGWFETLALSDRFQVKQIVVKPGGILSLQSHIHRSEHWIVVAGTARVTINDEEQLVTENQSVYVPLGAKHRMENPGKLPMVLIEVQTGVYLGEDDIVRYEDAYARE